MASSARFLSARDLSASRIPNPASGESGGPQRVVLIGAPESGKTTAVLSVFASDDSRLGLGVPRDDELPVPGVPLVSKHRLRMTVAPSALEERENSMDNRSVTGSVTGGAASDRPRVTVFQTDVTRVAVGAANMLPVDFLELRDTDAEALVHDRVLGRDVLTAQTTAVIVTIDAGTLVSRPPLVRRVPLEHLARTLAKAPATPQSADIAPTTKPAAGNSGSKAPQSPARSSQTAAPAAPGQKRVQLPPDPMAADDDDLIAVLERVDEEDLRGHFVRQVEAALETADATDVDFNAAVRLVRSVIDAVQRHHPAPPMCRVVVALTKADSVVATMQRRQLVLAEAERAGNVLVRQRAELLRRATAHAVTAVQSRTASVAASRGEGHRALPHSAAIALDETAAATAAQRRLRHLTQRLVAAVGQLAPNDSTGSGGSGDAAATAALLSRQSSTALTRRTSSLMVPSTPSSRPSWPTLEPEYVVTSARTDGADSIAHLFNALLLPPAETCTKLRKLLDAVRKNTRLHAATIVDLHSQLVVATDTGSAARSPNAGLSEFMQNVRELSTSGGSRAFADVPPEALAETATRVANGDNLVWIGPGGVRRAATGHLYGSAADMPGLVSALADPARKRAASPAAPGTKKRASFAPSVSDNDLAASSIETLACEPRGALTPWRWRRGLRTVRRMGRALAPKPAAPEPSASRQQGRGRASAMSLRPELASPERHPSDAPVPSDVLHAKLAMDDGSVLVVFAMTEAQLALAGTIAAKDVRNVSHVDYNVGLLRHTIGELLRPRSSASPRASQAVGDASGGVLENELDGGDSETAIASGRPRRAEPTRTSALQPKRRNPRPLVQSPEHSPGNSRLHSPHNSARVVRVVSPRGE